MRRPLLAILTLSLLPVLSAQVRIAPDKVEIDVGGEPFTALYSGPETNKPYLWPLRTADGKVITRRWPMEQNTGETHDHIHHRGLWFAYDDVNGVKFWESDPSYHRPGMGKIVVAGLRWTDGDRTGTLTGDFNWNDPEGKTLLVEHRVMTFHDDPQLRVIDFDITLTPREKVTFGDTKEGAFAIRLADALREGKGTGHMTSATGGHGEKEVWGKTSNWVDYYGTIDGEAVGVAIFDAPGNARPARWHARAYGLFSVDPFGQHAFDPSLPESHWAVAAGHPVHFRYRVVIHPGDTESAQIANLYADWTRTIHSGHSTAAGR